MQVWKFDLEITDTPIVKMPEGAEILSLQVQDGKPRIWALVNPEKELVSRVFHIKGTGHNCKRDTMGKYIGTFIVANDSFVGHVFEV